MFLRARTGAMLHQVARPGLLCEQNYKPAFDALAREGWSLARRKKPKRSSICWYWCPPRQRQEARGRCWRGPLPVVQRAERWWPAWSMMKGRVPANRTSKRSRASQAAFPKVTAGCTGRRWMQSAATPSCSLRGARWMHLARFWTDASPAGRECLPGTVSIPHRRCWQRNLPPTLSGGAADLGCGFGYLSVELLQRCPESLRWMCMEADRRALDLARQNLASFAHRAAVKFEWHDVMAGLPRRYNVIVCNPPFHAQGAGSRPDIGRAFIAVAAEPYCLVGACGWWPTGICLMSRCSMRDSAARAS